MIHPDKEWMKPLVMIADIWTMPIVYIPVFTKSTKSIKKKGTFEYEFLIQDSSKINRK